MYTSKILVLCAAFAAVLAAPQLQGGRVKISLYYEGLCPYCQDFIVNQLYPTYWKLGTFMDVEMIPYGNTKREENNGTWSFICQHGEEECYSNKLQACYMNQENFVGGILNFAKCLFEGRPDEETAEECTKKRGNWNWAETKACVDGKQGDELMAELGAKQDALAEKVEYTPWILINDVHDEQLEIQARTDLKSLVCSYRTIETANCP